MKIQHIMLAFMAGGCSSDVPANSSQTQQALKVKTNEARSNLRRLFDGAIAYYQAEHTTHQGVRLPAQFPKSTALVPATTACKNGKAAAHESTYQVWGGRTWQSLNFATHGPSYYQYQFLAEGKTFTARAIGDLDCDGILSTFEWHGTMLDDGTVSNREDPDKTRIAHRPFE